VLGALALPAAAHGAALSVTPGIATAGAPVTVDARGLTPRAAGVATLAGAPSRRFRADARGRARVVLRLRPSAHGSRRLTVRAGARRVSTRLTVVASASPSSTLAALSGGPRVLLDPSSGRPGDPFTLRISGFGRRTALTVRLGAVTVARRRTTRGTLVLSLAVPALGPGAQRLVVRSARTVLGLAFELLSPPPAPPPPPPPPPPPGDAVFVGAGDIAACNNPGDEATAALLDAIPGTVFTLGDNVYPTGTLAQYQACYASSWGRHKSRTMPVAGNHEYDASGNTGYFDYFGPRAGTPGKGYYSFELGTWHVVVLNSNCSFVGGCQAGSAQEQWLRADLAAHQASCTVALWHHPRFSSGGHGNDVAMQPFWQDLYDAGADLVLSGHDHDYERFAPQTPTGAADPAYGLREIVAGTGGASHSPIATVVANSEVRDADTFGVLKLTLRGGSYDWQFVPEAGKTFTDAGSGSCHGAPGS
jgi:hypothetical protein